MKKGDKVHYVPFEGCTNDDCKNGVVKNAFSGLDTHIYVAFDCCHEPEEYMKYKGIIMPLSKLEPDWVEQSVPEPEVDEEEEGQW